MQENQISTLKTLAKKLRAAKEKEARGQSTFIDLDNMLSDDFVEMVPEDFLEMLSEIKALIKEYQTKAEDKIQEEVDCVNRLSDHEGYIAAGNEALFLATGRNSI